MHRLFSAALLLTVLAGCGGDDSPSGPSASGELVIEDLVSGTGSTAAAPGDVVTVHYTGTFLDGRVFDSSAGRDPISFRLGVGAVIPGFDLGIRGMRVGGRRRLTIPPNLAYGSTGSGPIPPNATLRFEVELVALAR